MRFKIIIPLIMLFSGSCRKDAATTFKNVKGTLASAAGCSWIIRQDNGTYWEPLNLNSFLATLNVRKPVIFSFVLTNYGSVCMMGQVIKLTSIQNQ
jgi:hypothetical protein